MQYQHGDSAKFSGVSAIRVIKYRFIKLCMMTSLEAIEPSLWAYLFFRELENNIEAEWNTLVL
jgi:hypothetical protein